MENEKVYKGTISDIMYQMQKDGLIGKQMYVGNQNSPQIGKYNLQILKHSTNINRMFVLKQLIQLKEKRGIVWYYKQTYKDMQLYEEYQNTMFSVEVEIQEV